MGWKQPSIILLFVGAAACGGTSSSGALEIRVNESHLAPVPIAQRQAVSDAEQAVFLAEWQVKYTETELSIAETDIKVAKNEIAQAKLSAKTADTRQAHADKTADRNLIGEANQLERVAELEMQVAEQGLVRARQRVDYLKARLEAERLIHRREEARVEYAKAQGMTAAGVKPPKFDAKRYKAQYQERERMAKQATAQAQQKQKVLTATEQKLTAAKTRLKQAHQPASLPMEKPGATPPGTTATEPVEAPAEPPPETAPEQPADETPAQPADRPTDQPATPDSPPDQPDQPDQPDPAPTEGNSDDDASANEGGAQ